MERAIAVQNGFLMAEYCRIEAMKAANAAKAYNHEAPAYTEADFMCCLNGITQCISNLQQL